MAKSILPKLGKLGKVSGGGSTKALPTQDSIAYKGSNKKTVKKGNYGGGNGSGMSYN